MPVHFRSPTTSMKRCVPPRNRFWYCPGLLDTVPRFPVETVVDNCGICSDKRLLAVLLSIEGYASAILHIGQDYHAAVGIPVPTGHDFTKCGYVVIDTTAISYVGGQPLAQNGSSKLRKPMVIPIGSGTKTYSAIRNVAQIHAVVDKLDTEISPGRYARIRTHPPAVVHPCADGNTPFPRRRMRLCGRRRTRRSAGCNRRFTATMHFPTSFHVPWNSWCSFTTTIWTVRRS